MLSESLKTLIIGSTVADVVVNIDKLPKTGEDSNTKRQSVKLGGCAFNVSEILRHSKTPYVLCSPVGCGIYGDFVASRLAERNIVPFVRLDSVENGCCYCFVENDGERTFIAHHGAEYLFHKEWMKSIPENSFDSAFVCGIELEEPTGKEILEFLVEQRKKKSPDDFQIFLAVSSRVAFLPLEMLEKLLSLNPVLHLSLSEAKTLAERCCGIMQSDVSLLAEALYEKTGNCVIITSGSDGAYLFENPSSGLVHCPACRTKVIDTIGAGDSHLGAVISAKKKGFSYEEAVKKANKVSAKVVGTEGAGLTDAQFAEIGF